MHLCVPNFYCCDTILLLSYKHGHLGPIFTFKKITKPNTNKNALCQQSGQILGVITLILMYQNLGLNIYNDYNMRNIWLGQNWQKRIGQYSYGIWIHPKSSTIIVPTADAAVADAYPQDKYNKLRQ